MQHLPLLPVLDFSANTFLNTRSERSRQSISVVKLFKLLCTAVALASEHYIVKRHDSIMYRNTLAISRCCLVAHLWFYTEQRGASLHLSMMNEGMEMFFYGFTKWHEERRRHPVILLHMATFYSENSGP